MPKQYTMFSKQLKQTPLSLEIVITAFLITLLTVNIVTHVSSIQAMTGNRTSGGTDNMTFVGNMTGGKNMMMPGGNMTFGASLQNAKMHLTEAIMDLKTGNTRGAMMEMNLTTHDIKMHEQEIKGMMMDVKGMMEQIKGNTTSSSMLSKNAT